VNAPRRYGGTPGVDRSVNHSGFGRRDTVIDAPQPDDHYAELLQHIEHAHEQIEALRREPSSPKRRDIRLRCSKKPRTPILAVRQLGPSSLVWTVIVGGHAMLRRWELTPAAALQRCLDLAHRCRFCLITARGG
jgi:hypothetical protein